MYDIIIVGAGPAGLTAALYARRAEKSVLVLEKETFGGQITYSPKVENYPGMLSVSGNELAEKLIEQVFSHGADVEPTDVTEVRDFGDRKIVTTTDGEYEAKAVIIAAGSKHRRLGLDREESFIGNGISFCAICDGAFYKDKNVAVIGGGNTALQDSVLLSEGCRSVTIVQNLATLTGEQKLINILVNRPNVNIIYNTVVEALNGESELKSISLSNTVTSEKTLLKVDGIFVAIGQVPENEPFTNVVSTDERGYIISGEDCMTTTPGVFVAGDCRTKAIRQVATAVSDGAIAALSAIKYIDSIK